MILPQESVKYGKFIVFGEYMDLFHSKWEQFSQIKIEWSSKNVLNEVSIMGTDRDIIFKALSVRRTVISLLGNISKILFLIVGLVGEGLGRSRPVRQTRPSKSFIFGVEPRSWFMPKKQLQRTVSLRKKSSL